VGLRGDGKEVRQKRGEKIRRQSSMEMSDDLARVASTDQLAFKF